MPSLPRRLARRARAELARVRRTAQQRSARRILSTGLFDRAWYERQTGRTWSDDRAAARHYLADGRRSGRSPHPLVEPDWINPPRARRGRREAVEAYLAGAAARGGPHPLFDDATWLATAPDARTHPGGPLGHFLATAGAGAALPCPWAVRPVSPADLREALDRPPGAGETPAAGAAREDQPGLTSVVVTLRDSWPEAWSLVDEALVGPAADDRTPDDRAPVEVVVVHRGSSPSAARILASRQLADPRVQVVRQPGGAVGRGWQAGLARTSGARVVLADAVLVARPLGSPARTAWWQPLAAALDDPGVAAAAPLVVGRGGLLEHAGLGVHREGAPPYRILHAAAPEDALGPPIEVAALGDEAVAARRDDLLAVLAPAGDDGGGGPLGGCDLSARLAALGPQARRLRVVPTVTLFRTTDGPVPSPDGPLPSPPAWDEDAAWRRSGLELVAADPEPVLGRRVEPVPEGPAAGQPALRWAIGTAAPFSAHGDLWGDVHFAGDLAAALRRLGQHVVVERRAVAGRTTAGFDEVFLNLRGLDALPPRPGQVNLLWVISHPDLVAPEEVRSYDAVFSAGLTWARTMTARAGRTVRVLLQATDPDRFHPGLAEPDSGPVVLFVGNSRGVQRPIVRDAVAAGLDLAVYGTRWEGLLDPRYVRGTYLPNESVGAAYRAAGVVLNDHWPDMAAQGFCSNRLFDAVAAGARVISDPVEGIGDLFEGAVLEYRSPADLAGWAGPGRASAFPDDAARSQIAARVGRDHSFDARAATLLATALELRAVRAS